jgi:hypothetical protein
MTAEAKRRDSSRQPRGNDKAAQRICHSRASSLLAREESRSAGANAVRDKILSTYSLLLSSPILRAIITFIISLVPA